MDVLIGGGRLIDGSGTPWRYADVGITGGRIVAIGQLAGTRARLNIDTAGRIVCPGFIDMHSHADLSLITGRQMSGRLRQGITTEVVGQDGLSYAPAGSENLEHWRRYLRGLNGDAPRNAFSWSSVGEFLDELHGRAANAVYLIPHGAVRVEAMGWVARRATSQQLSTMRALVLQGMSEGAAGISTGLSYAPCSHATTDEMVALCNRVAAAGGIYVTHLRTYGPGLLDALQEAVRIGQQADIAVHVSHLRVAESANWGLSEAIVQTVDRARASGIDITFDLYPYTAGCAPLFVLLPSWAQSGGPAQILARLEKRSEVECMVDEMSNWDVDWSTYTLSNLSRHLAKAWSGTRLVDVAASLDMEVESAIAHLLLDTGLNATIVASGGNEDDNDLLFQHPACMVASDGVLLGQHPHPRGYGCFPRFLASYVVQKKLVRWEEAIQKMTGMPAARLGLQDRGLLRIGAAADIVILDPERVEHKAAYDDGRHRPAGVEWVFVNGKAVVENESYLGGEPGEALRPQLTIQTAR